MIAYNFDHININDIDSHIWISTFNLNMIQPPWLFQYFKSRHIKLSHLKGNATVIATANIFIHWIPNNHPSLNNHNTKGRFFIINIPAYSDMAFSHSSHCKAINENIKLGSTSLYRSSHTTGMARYVNHKAFPSSEKAFSLFGYEFNHFLPLFPFLFW